VVVVVVLVVEMASQQ